MTSKDDLSREKRIKRMKKIIAAYKRYVSTYASEDYNADCQDKTFVLDMLYGIGISIEKESYYAADGFDRFKAKLRELLT
jgi:hypothetical protein